MNKSRNIPRRARVATILLAAALIFVASGCYYGSSDIAAPGGAAWCPVGVDLGPGHISSGGNGSGNDGSLWQPAPTTMTLQFAVTSSDGRPNRIEVAATNPFISSESFGVVWDGTTSTGSKSILWNGSPFALTIDVLFSAHMNWWMKALDASGKEVGFTCVPFSPA